MGLLRWRTRWGHEGAKLAERTRHIMAMESGREWVGTPLDTDDVDPDGIVEIIVEFDEWEEVLTPRLNEPFGSYDLHEVANYIHYISGHIVKGRE